MALGLKAGIFYFGLVFAIGFVLGALRVSMVAPQVGALNAVLIELPLIITAAWAVCRTLISVFVVPPSFLPRLVMGVLAFLLLIAAERVMGEMLGTSLDSYLADLLTPAGMVGLAGQCLFALFPLIQIITNR